MNAGSQNIGVKGTSDLTKGLGLMMFAMLILPSMDIIAKYVSENISGAQVAQARFGFQMIMLAPFILATRGFDGLIPNKKLAGMAFAALLGTFAVGAGVSATTPANAVNFSTSVQSSTV